MAFGESKAPIVADSIEGKITENIPASFLQEHHNCTFFLDEASSQELTRFKAPWLADHIEWTEKQSGKLSMEWPLHWENHC